MSSQAERYKKEDGKVVIELAVNRSRQLFDERDPAPFRARDLDDDFVNYVLSAAQEFPLKTEMKIRIVVLEESDQSVDINAIHEAIRSHFLYESNLAQMKLRKQLRVGRFFLVMGLLVLFACLGFAQFVESWLGNEGIGRVVGEGFVIVGWVAMWRPIEVVLYDWWPMRELRQYLIKVATMSVDVTCLAADNNSK